MNNPNSSDPLANSVQRSTSDMGTIVSYSHSGPDALAYLRLLGPAEQLGLRVVSGMKDGHINVERVHEGDVVVLQRDFPVHLAQYEEILALAHSQGKPLILDLDDLLFELPSDHPDSAIHLYTKALLPMLQAVTEADLVTVATPALRDYVLHYSANVIVLPNYFNDKLWRLRSPASARGTDGKVIVGYMGSITHAPDLQMIVPVLLEMLNRYTGTLELHFWGMQPPAALATLPGVYWHPIESGPYPEFAAYFQAQAADIFIAPLQENLFNACKSAVKFLEYSALGAPGVFSRVQPYSSVITDGTDGLLAASLADWAEALTSLIENPDLRLEIATRAQDTIRSRYLLSKNAGQWIDAYRSATECVRGGGVPTSALHSLVASLARQTAGLFEAQQQSIQQLNARLEQRSHLGQGLEQRLREKLRPYARRIKSSWLWQWTAPLRQAKAKLTRQG